MDTRVLTVAACLATALLLPVHRLDAQEFVPPDRRPGAQPATPSAPSDAPPAGLRVELLAFSTRGGAQVNKNQQFLLGSTLDVVQLWTPQARIRGSFEVGFGNPTTSLAVNAEVVYRLQPDHTPAIPYVGLGVGYYDDSSATKVWPTVVMGFELRFRRSMNWLLEYHALDGLKRSRFLIGLATRPGGD
jgi:hypothetical protein